MKFPLPAFGPEVWLAKYKTSPHLFYASSAEPLTLRELRAMEDDSIASMWETLVLKYAETKGHPQLLREIAALYGPAVSDENILCFPGAQTGIFSIMASLLSENDHCVVVGPCYPSLENLPAAICETTTIHLEYERQWELDLNAIEHSLRPNTKLIVLNSPNNPTGSLLSAKAQDELVYLARKHHLWIFSDEVYRLLELNPSDRLPAMASVYEKGLSLGVMSKAYGLGGLCIGWVACQNTEILQETAKLKHYLAVSNSAVSEIQAIVALRSGEEIIARQRRFLLDNIRLLDQFFKDYGNWFEWVRPKSGCVAFVRFKGRISVDDLALRLIEEVGVLVMPARLLGFQGEFFRIGFGRSTMPASLNQFAKFADENKKSW